MTNSNKQRGNRGERKVAAYLTKVFDLPFTRVPTSGALVGGKNIYRKETLDNTQVKLFSGDIIPPEQYNVTIEVKKSKVFSFHLLFDGKYALFDSWVKQARVPNQNWILFFDIDYVGMFIAVDEIFCQNIRFNKTNMFSYNDLMIYEAEHFFSKNKNIIDKLWRTKGDL